MKTNLKSDGLTRYIVGIINLYKKTTKNGEFLTNLELLCMPLYFQSSVILKRKESELIIIIVNFPTVSLSIKIKKRSIDLIRWRTLIH